MATVKNNWIGFLDRSYQQIKSALLSKLTNSNPEMTDHSESNPFVIIIDMFAGIAEMLNYYIDNVAEESFMATSSRRSSIINHSISYDYRIKARSPETVDLLIQFDQPSPQGFDILSNSSISNIDGFLFRTLEDVTVNQNDQSVILPMVQVLVNENINLGTSNGSANQEFPLGEKYVHKSIEVSVSGTLYFEVDSFSLSTAEDRHYVVDIKEDGIAYIRFGDGNKGFIPINAQDIIATYQETEGPLAKTDSGNFDENSLTLDTSISLPIDISSINNLLSSVGGENYESTESIRRNSVRSLRTLDRAVTEQDHVDILENLPGVSKAAIDYQICGGLIDLYIVPEGGGIAQSSLISTAQNEINDKKMVLTEPVVKASGESRLFLTLRVFAKRRRSLIQVKNEVEQALIDYTADSALGINSKIRLSDIQALVDNLPNVDYLDLTGLYIEPYASPSNHNTTLNWTRKVFPASTEVKNYRLEIEPSLTSALLYLDNTLKQRVNNNQLYVEDDGSFEFFFSSGGYSAGQEWEFKVLPFLRNTELDDFTVAKTSLDTLTVNVLQSDNL